MTILARLGILALLMGIGLIILFFWTRVGFRRWVYLGLGIFWLVSSILLFYFNWFEINALQASLAHGPY